MQKQGDCKPDDCKRRFVWEWQWVALSFKFTNYCFDNEREKNNKDTDAPNFHKQEKIGIKTMSEKKKCHQRKTCKKSRKNIHIYI